MPYTTGWLSRRRRCCSRRKNDGDGDGTPLTDDELAAVFARLVDAGDVVRCAATCRRWGRVVARHAAPASLSRGRPTTAYSSPTLALGFFHQEDASATTRKRKRTGAMARPCFVPIAGLAAARLLGFHRRRCSFPALSDDDMVAPSSSLEHSRPVASRNGRVVLELLREGHADDTGLKLCVCNPMTGDVSMLPPLDRPGLYACTLLTGDDLDIVSSSTTQTFFKVLIVYNRPSFTALRSYSSETRRWSAEVPRRRGKKKISTMRMQLLRHAVVLRGVAYWTLGFTAFAVRFDTPEPVELAMPPRGHCDLWPNNRVLGATPDGKLVFLYMLRRADFMAAVAMVLQPPPPRIAAGDDDDMSKWEWQFSHIHIKLRHLKVENSSAINVRWFYEKSGIVLFTLGDEHSSCPGTYALNLTTREAIKLSTSHSWTNFCGYEMDHAASLASIVNACCNEYMN